MAGVKTDNFLGESNALSLPFDFALALSLSHKLGTAFAECGPTAWLRFFFCVRNTKYIFISPPFISRRLTSAFGTETSCCFTITLPLSFLATSEKSVS